ncbi:MAG: SBBP repeat-containing protein [Bryobacteraceae bacterium]
MAGFGSAPGRGEMLNKLPLRFEEQRGEGAAVSYVARGADFSVRIAPNESWLERRNPARKAVARVRSRLLGANSGGPMEATEPPVGQVNYLVGPADRWRTGVGGFGRIRQRNVYDGISMVFHGEEGLLEYDFLVAPYANPEAIRMELTGQQGLRIETGGDLVVATAAGDIRWKRPEIYQEANGKRTPVAGKFRLSGKRVVSFEIGAYDRSRELVIDPTLSYATYLGGAANEGARGIGLDAAGNVYLAGKTTSTDLKTVNALQANFGGMTANYLSGDAFVAKFSPAGALVYLTYLGGTGDEGATALAVDAGGNVYLTGATTSSDFPIVNGYQKAFGGLGGGGYARTGDAFLAKLDATGKKLVYSTYFGGARDDLAMAIAIDGAGNAFIAGSTLSTNFPTTQGAYQVGFKGTGGQPFRDTGTTFIDTGDAFVAKFNPSGQLVFSTLVGGGLDDIALTIAVDSTGNVYIGGFTLSSDFPTTNGALSRRFGGTEDQNFFFDTGDGFVAKLNPTGTALVYSTYFGGFGDDCVSSIAVDSTGAVYMTGFTSTTNLRTSTNAFQPAFAGYVGLPFLIEYSFGDGFVATLNPAGSALVYLSYLGGNANDGGAAIAIDSAGNAFVVGFTDSTNFPTAGSPLQATLAGHGGGGSDLLLYGDAFVAMVNPDATKLLYSSYYGGTFDDGATGLALDGSGRALVAGITVSSNLKVTDTAAQKTYGGGQSARFFPKGDAFFAVFSGFPIPAPVLGAITNGASNLVTPVSPGLVFVAYGTNMGPSATASPQLDSNGRLASTVAGAQMLFDGTPAPIVYAGAGQFSGIVPYSVAGKQTVQVVSVYQGQTSAAFPVTVAPAAPGLFSSNFTGSGQAQVYNEDNTLNSSANAAARGAIVQIFGTGEGLLSPALPDGSFVPTAPFPSPTLNVSVTVGGSPASEILYKGVIPGGLVGVIQINARLSPNTPVGNQAVVVTIGNVASQPNLTIAVK